jgi:hypothetical protein
MLMAFAEIRTLSSPSSNFLQQQPVSISAYSNILEKRRNFDLVE